MTEMLKKKKEKIVYISYILLTLKTSTLQNGQTHSNFLRLSSTVNELLECV